MRHLVILLFICIVVDVLGQAKSNKPKAVPVDTLVLLGGRKIPAAKISIGAAVVSYTLLTKQDSLIRVDKKEVEMVLYKNGNKEILQKPVVMTVSDDQWQAVLVTEKEKEVAGMYKRGFFKANGAPNAKNAKKARESAIVKLQKYAAAVKASIVLITKEEKFGGYGDNPGIYMEGVAYGTEPLEEGTNVVDGKKDSDSNKKANNKKADDKKKK